MQQRAAMSRAARERLPAAQEPGIIRPIRKDGVAVTLVEEAPHEPMWWDPLADLRGRESPTVGVFMSGTVVLDIVFTGLPTGPRPGTEVWASGMASCPGGIAN